MEEEQGGLKAKLLGWISFLFFVNLINCQAGASEDHSWSDKFQLVLQVARKVQVSFTMVALMAIFITVSPHIFCFESLLLYANEVTDSVEVGTLNLLALCQCILNTEVVNEVEEGN